MIGAVGSVRAIAWAVATVVGLVLGGFALHFPGSATSAFDPTALVFGTLLGGVNGLAVGLLQSATLWRAVDRGARRAWTMGVIVGGTHGAYDGLPQLGGLLPIGAGVFAALAVSRRSDRRRGRGRGPSSPPGRGAGRGARRPLRACAPRGDQSVQRLTGVGEDSTPRRVYCGLSRATEVVSIRPSTVKRHLADLRARSGLSTEQLIYAGRAAGWLGPEP